jgi:hypothetical protein
MPKDIRITDLALNQTILNKANKPSFESKIFTFIPLISLNHDFLSCLAIK